MIRKIIAAVALAVLGVFAIPLAASAAPYTPAGSCGLGGSPVPSGTVVVTCVAGTWQDNEPVQVLVTGNTGVTVAVFKLATTSTGTVTASGTGSSVTNIALPADASGTYTVQQTGTISGAVDTETFTVVTAAGTTTTTTSTSGLAATGTTLPLLIIWTASGLVLLGVAIVAVRIVVRRQRLNS